FDLTSISSDSPLLGDNTPRSDEDRLKLVELMVFLLKKGVCDEIGLNAARLSKLLLSGKYAAKGFEQIIDFLSGSYIHYALTVSPHIYISCIKQFWNSVSVKHSGVVCLSNEEIFTGLAQMGYKKPSTKLAFYKDFFSSQWKFLIHTILQSLSAKRTSWNEFSTTMVSAVICLSKGQKFNFSKVGKGFSGVETPLFEGMIAERQPAEKELGAEQVQVDAAIAVAIVEDVDEDVVHIATPSPPPHGILSPHQEPSSPPHQPPCPPQPQYASLLFQQCRKHIKPNPVASGAQTW
nr:hypothetical protein [Tanacetum cinerariifolium]